MGRGRVGARRGQRAHSGPGCGERTSGLYPRVGQECLLCVWGCGPEVGDRAFPRGIDQVKETSDEPVTSLRLFHCVTVTGKEMRTV